MSKVDDLRQKYRSMSIYVFNILLEGDKTPTKKYLEYMLKIRNKSTTYQISNDKIVEIVMLFDNLLPYIDNKDIYSNEYTSFKRLIQTIENAQKIKMDKTFVKKDHVIIIDDNDDYLFIYPKTTTGSNKYGYGTKWCTSAMGQSNRFNNYQNGTLCYLINKKGEKKNCFEKIAFYREKPDPMDGNQLIYNANDTVVTTRQLINGGWDTETINKIQLQYFSFIQKYQQIKKSIDNLKSLEKMLNSIDVTEIQNDIKIVGESRTFINSETLKETINEFINKLNNIKI